MDKGSITDRGKGEQAVGKDVLRNLSIGDGIFLAAMWGAAGFVAYWCALLISVFGLGLVGIAIVFGAAYKGTRVFFLWKAGKEEQKAGKEEQIAEEI